MKNNNNNNETNQFDTVKYQLKGVWNMTEFITKNKM